LGLTPNVETSSVKKPADDIHSGFSCFFRLTTIPTIFI